MTDEEPSESELAEARALAEALESGKDAGGIPSDAAATAALLRFEGDRGQLDAERGDQILAELMAAQARRPVKAKAKWSVWFWLGLPTAAAALVAVGVSLDSPTNLDLAQLPAPSSELLAAQARAATLGAAGRNSKAPASAELATLMKDYRGQVLAALKQP